MAPRKSSTDQSKQDKERFPSLFAWAESYAVRHARILDDVTTASTTAVPTVCFLLAAAWFQAEQGTVLRLVLALGAVFTLLLTFVSWGTKAYHSQFEKKSALIAVHVGSLTGVAITLIIVFGIFLSSDLSLIGQQTAQKLRDEQQAALEREERRDEERKRDELRLKEADEVRRVEATCQKARLTAIEIAKNSHGMVRNTYESCKADYAKMILPLESLVEHCKPAKVELDNAKQRLARASSVTCSTGSTGKSQ